MTAKTFADPPLNTIGLTKTGSLTKTGDWFVRDGLAILPVPQHLAGMADGHYTIGFHPHHLSIARPHETAAVLKAKVIISEIAGSESFIHVEAAGSRRVMLEHGIHDFEPDTMIDLFVDIRHLMTFADGGRAVIGAASQKEA